MLAGNVDSVQIAANLNIVQIGRNLVKNIAVVIGHPFKDSFSHALTEAYVDGATEAGAAVRVIDLATTNFTLSPAELNDVRVRSINNMPGLEPEIVDMVHTLDWADHIVLIYPVWWGTFPGILKSFIDRTVLSGVAFNYGKTGTKWDKKWTGKTARLIFTMDAPAWWYKLTYRAPSENAMRKATFWYVGVKTIGVTRFTPVRFSTPEIRAKWLAKVGKLGKKDGSRS